MIGILGFLLFSLILLILSCAIVLSPYEIKCEDNEKEQWIKNYEEKRIQEKKT
jgi:hypothetical protein